MCLVGSLADQPRKTVEGKRERERGGEKGRKEKNPSMGFSRQEYTLLYLNWITNKDLLYSKGTLLSVVWQPGW